MFMIPFLNKIKNNLIYSENIPRIYTFFTRPFDAKLRHLVSHRDMVPARPKKVSVVIPNYNYAHFINARIDSIVDQTYPIHELIILDDASTDNSDEIINQKIINLKNTHKNLEIKYLRNKKNTGSPILQWRRAFAEATGDFVWIAEADDFSDPRFLEKLMPAFDDEDVILSYSDSVAINDSGHVLHYHFSARAGKYCKSHFKKSYVYDGMAERELCLGRRCTIPNVSAVIFRKTPSIPYDQYLTEASQFTQVGDWYLYLRLARHGKISFTSESLNFFRIHRGSATRENNKKNKHQEEIAYIQSHLDMI